MVHGTGKPLSLRSSGWAACQFPSGLCKPVWPGAKSAPLLTAKPSGNAVLVPVTSSTP